MKYGSIAGGEKSTVNAACQILENGGNAFDAAIGAVFTSMVSEYNLTGLGGGGALLAYPVNSDPVLYDFFVDTLPPQKEKKLDFFSILVDFGPSQQEFHIGQGSVGVPGNCAGLLYVHKKLGKLPLRIVLEPAVYAAKSGVVLNEAQAYLIKILKPILTHSRSGKFLFEPDGKLLKQGDIFRNPAFADLMEKIAIEGSSYFYKGNGAKLILNALGEQGLITKESLSNYRVIERKPLKSKFNEKIIFTNPAPAIGGTLITFALQLLEQSKMNYRSDFLNLAKTMEITSIARKEIYHNTENKFEISDIIKPKIFKNYLELLDTGNSVLKNNSDPDSTGSTTHVSIIDKDGNAVSVTTTNGEGCGYVIPEMGVMLNNMLGEEDLNPQGFQQWTYQKRLPTMISPTIVMGSRGVEMVLGSGGSNRLRSAICQVIINFFIKNMDLESAIFFPRIHLDGKVLHFEPGIPLELLSDNYKLHSWDKINLFFGGVNAVTKTSAIGDPRREGAGINF